jgi:hypothetical protein
MKVSTADILLGTDGRLYVCASALPLANRAGRRVLRVLALTPGEENELRRRIGDLTDELLAGLPPKGGAR